MSGVENGAKLLLQYFPDILRELGVECDSDHGYSGKKGSYGGR